MSVSGPRKATCSGRGSSFIASWTISSAPAEGIGVLSSGIGPAAPSATVTLPSSSIRRSSSKTSSWLSCRLCADLMLPKWAGTMPCSSKVGVSRPWTMAYWSSASFLASVLMMTRLRLSDPKGMGDVSVARSGLVDQQDPIVRALRLAAGLRRLKGGIGSGRGILQGTGARIEPARAAGRAGRSSRMPPPTGR